MTKTHSIVVPVQVNVRLIPFPLPKKMPLSLIQKTENGDLALEGVPVHIKGTVTSESELPISGNVVGEAYFVVWTGEQWAGNGTHGNGGGYVLPEGGIPKSDLSNAVQNALGLAENAIQTETDPVYTADKPTLALKSELPDISGLATKAEVQTVTDIANGKLDATTSIDIFGTLSAATPFSALILKPTTASFATQHSALMFSDDELKRMIAVLFTSNDLGTTQIGQVLKLLGLEIPNDSQGMWVISILFDEDLFSIDPNEIQLFQITDGSNILVPEVNLAELTGLEFGDMFTAVDDEGGIFHGNLEEENFRITSIVGCEICFRFTQAQALQYLLDQKTGRLAIADSELSPSSKSKLLSTIHSGVNPLTLLNTIRKFLGRREAGRFRTTTPCH